MGSGTRPSEIGLPGMGVSMGSSQWGFSSVQALQKRGLHKNALAVIVSYHQRPACSKPARIVPFEPGTSVGTTGSSTGGTTGSLLRSTRCPG